MLRFLAVFLALFAGAVACVSLLPSPPEPRQPPSAIAAHVPDAVSPRPSVRVVYPGPGAEQASGEGHPTVGTARTDDATDTKPAAPAAISAPVQNAAVYPQVQSTGSVGAMAAAGPVNPAAQVGGPGVNLNTASIDVLDQIPGAGRIGRTIASHRPYHSVADLLTKRVVKRSVYDRIKDQVAAE